MERRGGTAAGAGGTSDRLTSAGAGAGAGASKGGGVGSHHPPKDGSKKERGGGGVGGGGGADGGGGSGGAARAGGGSGAVAAGRHRPEGPSNRATNDGAGGATTDWHVGGHPQTDHIEDDKERKRLKRLLRNRVSAQQARERKTAYMSTLEDDRRDIEAKMAEMEAKINTLERENFMLRQVAKNATQGEGS